ncbi:MAG: hypothetical protein R2932_07200 [Caldilineaceae bacterium]
MTLQWTPPADVMTTTLRYSTVPLTEETWAEAGVLAEALAGDATTFTATLPMTDNTYYLGLRTQNVAGLWSPLSNPGFWPQEKSYLPLIQRR